MSCTGRILASPTVDTLPPMTERPFTWHNVQEWGVEGKGWTDLADTKHYFDRLPARADGVVREVVWNLSRHSTGLTARFETDATEIRARWSFRVKPNLMLHMPAVASCGLDLYATAPDGQLRWLGIGRPEGIFGPSASDGAPNSAGAAPLTVEATLAEAIDPGPRAYTVYLPLFALIATLEIGVPSGAAFTGIPPRTEPPIAFYGTSIVHGASASRPGMTHVAQLGRRLNLPVLNLGFSGNGQMEPDVARFLAELSPRIFVVDCLPNMQGPMVAERAEPLVRIIRAARPETPIVLVEDRTYANAPFKAAQRERQSASRRELRKAFERLKESGIGGLHYVEGEQLLGDDGEATVDSSHPTDLGFTRQADVLERVLRRLL